MHGNLVVHGLSKKYESVTALHPTTFSVQQGETLGIIGETGSGKSTLAKMLVGLLEPTSGSVHYGDHSLFDLSNKALKHFRQKVQMVFQDPYASLNPRMTIRSILLEPLKIHHLPYASLGETLAAVGLPEDLLTRYPRQLSGGQRQRVAIARALITKPHYLICDEILSALDLSIQGQIANLLNTLKKDYNLTILFIGHDLPMVRYLSDQIAVLHRGSLVEWQPTDQLFTKPQNPYTKQLVQHAQTLSLSL
ncbi:MAG: ABC transporter ATP-binding protein [Chlamydiia bacterium]|nr:ABC transporter ATP-binding protein [Chlamydiia bacterium]